VNKQRLIQLSQQHSVLGVIAATLLIIVFVCGVLLFFRGSLSSWQFGWNLTSAPAKAMSWQSAIASLLEAKPELADSRVTLTTDPQHQHMFQVYVGHDERFLYNNQAGSVLSDGALSDFLYFLHINFTTHIVGKYLIAFACILLIMVVLSGLLIRWRDLVARFHLYRTQGKPRAAVLDLHLLLGIGTLLFLLMYGWSSAWFNTGFNLTFPVYQHYADENDLDYWEEAGFPSWPVDYDSAQALTAAGVNSMLSDFQARYPGLRIARVDFYAAPWRRVRIRGESDTTLNFVTAFYGVDGGLLMPPERRPLTDVYTLMVQLHEGHLLGKASHLIYLVLSLMAIAAMCFGNIYWLLIRESRRQQQRLFRCQRFLLEAGSAGALCTLAILLLATRSAGMAEPLTTGTNQLIVVLALLICGSATLCYQRPAQSLLRVLLAAAIGYALMPLIDLAIYASGYRPYDFAVGEIIRLNVVFAALSGFCFAMAALVRTMAGRYECARAV